MFIYKKYGPTGPCHIRVQQNRLTSLIKMVHNTYNQGASKAPPAAPPSGGGGGPPLPAPGGGGGSSAGPPCPGGRRPLVIAAAQLLAAESTAMAGGNPTHCSRTLLVLDLAPHALRHVSQNRLKTTDYILIRSGCRRRSMRWPRTRVIPAAPLRRSLRSCWSPSSRIPRTPRTPRRSVLLRRHRCLDHVHLSPTRCHICTNTKQTTNNDISVYTSKHVH
jgi:hypothetical protein